MIRAHRQRAHGPLALSLSKVHRLVHYLYICFHCGRTHSISRAVSLKTNVSFSLLFITICNFISFITLYGGCGCSMKHGISSWILRIRVLENHLFLDPGIGRLIAARDVLKRRCTTTRLFQLYITKQVLHWSSSTRVIGVKKCNPH
jgi:hypothetical protein